MTDALTRIEEAISNNDIARARELLRDALLNPTADTYYLASHVALNQSQRVQFLEKALELDPFHQQAADELAQLRRLQQRSQAIDSAAGSEGAKVLSADRVKTTPPATSLPGYDAKRLLLLALLGLVAALIMQFTFSIPDNSDLVRYRDWPFYGTWGALVLISFALIVHHWRSPLSARRWRYQLELLVLWVSCNLVNVFFTTSPLGGLDALLFFGMNFIGLSVLGGLALLFSRPRRDSQRNPS